MKLRLVAEHVQGQVAGDPDIDISGVAVIESAGPGDITFFNNARYRRHLTRTNAAAIILANPDDLPRGRSGIIASHPYLAFAMRSHSSILRALPIRVSIRSRPSHLTQVSENECTIGPFTVIDQGVVIGDDVTILSHCHIYPEAVLGNGVMIHSHSVVREGCQLGTAWSSRTGLLSVATGLDTQKDRMDRGIKFLRLGR